MPIEFHCKSCNHLVRTPDATAGKKGRCPNCQAIVDIPPASTAVFSDKPLEQTAASDRAGPQKPPASESTVTSANIASYWPPSRSSVSKSSSAPKPPSVPASPSASKRADSASPSTPQSAATGTIDFHCRNCNYVVRAPAAHAGKKGKCPKCQAVVDIPLTSTAPSVPSAPRKPAPRAAAPGLTPLSGPSSLTPLDVPLGLTPLDTPGLTSLDMGPGLTPLDGPPGLTPLDSSPGLTPLDPLDSLSSADLLGGPAMSGFSDTNYAASSFGSAGGGQLNPYTSPSGYSSSPSKPSRSSGRSGAQITTMVCGGFLIFYAIVQLVLAIVMMAMRGATMMPALGQLPVDADQRAFMVGSTIGSIVSVGLSILVFILILSGGIQMMRFKTWGLALTASILTFMPCNCPFFCIGIPLGIWAIIMLSLRDVREAFS